MIVRRSLALALPGLAACVVFTASCGGQGGGSPTSPTATQDAPVSYKIENPVADGHTVTDNTVEVIANYEVPKFTVGTRIMANAYLSQDGVNAMFGTAGGQPIYDGIAGHEPPLRGQVHIPVSIVDPNYQSSQWIIVNIRQDMAGQVLAEGQGQWAISR